MNRRTWLALVACSSGAVPILAGAQTYPDRSIRIVAPFAAGSTSDTSARFIAERLTKALGQAVVVDNTPGADGRLGMTIVKNAPADGYTLVMGSWTNLSVNPVVFKDLSYDPIKDFKPIAGVGRSMLGIVVPSGSPFQSLAELLAASRAKPDQLTFGNFGAGYRLAIHWLSNMSGASFSDVPYKSTGQMDADLAGGLLDAAMDGVTSLETMLRLKKVRLLAVTGDKRHLAHPDVPTVKETYPQFSLYGWSALMARSEVPDAVTDRLATAMEQIMTSPEGQEFAARVGSEPLLRSRDEMRQYQLGQIKIFRQVAQAAGLKPE